MTEPTTFETFGLSRCGRVACDDLLNASIDGRYTLESKLGEGGFGCVFLAGQKSPSRKVAVKVQKHAGRESRRMAQEADLLAKLDDRGIARVFEAGTWESPTGPRVFVAMELITDALPLHLHCKDRGLSVPDRLTLFLEVCRAVGVAHRAGIIHRDLKPSNILVDRNGQPRIIDFGISKMIASGQEERGDESREPHVAGPDDTRLGATLGTLGYAAPEQQGGKATTSSDVYALGQILGSDLFHDLAGKTPAWLRPIVARSTAAEPTVRPADAASLAADLVCLMRKRVWRPLVLAATAAAVCLVGGIMLWPDSGTPRVPKPSPPPSQQSLSIEWRDGDVAAAGDPTTGRLAVTRGDTIRVVSAGQPYRYEGPLFPIATPIRHVAFSGDGTTIASSDSRGWRAWDAARITASTWPIFEVRADSTATDHDRLIAVSPNGTTLFAQEAPCTLAAYQIRTGELLGRIKLAIAAAARITAVVPAAAADAAFVGLSDGTVHRWDVGKASPDKVRASHGRGDVFLATTADATRLASCGGDGVVTLLDATTSTVIAASPAMAGSFTAVCLPSPNDVVVASRLPDGGDTTVQHLSRRGAFMTVSGTTMLAEPVTALVFTGSSVVAFGRERNQTDAVAAVSQEARRSGF